MSSTRCGRKPSEHSVVNPRISCMPPPGLCGMSLSPTPTLVMAMSASIEDSLLPVPYTVAGIGTGKKDTGKPLATGLGS
jgi:hypothetical protein